MITNFKSVLSVLHLHISDTLNTKEPHNYVLHEIFFA